MTKKLIALLLFVTTISMAQEKALLRLNYEKGDAFVVKMKMNQVVEGAMEMNIGMNMEMDIKDVQDGVYSSEMSFKNTSIDMIMAGQTMSYNSDMKEEEMDPFAKGAHGQMKTLLETVAMFKYNEFGEITETKIISGSGDVSKFKENNNSIVYPKEAVTVGMEWKDSKTTSEGVNTNFVYKVTSIKKDKVLLDVTGTVGGIAKGDIKGTATIDRATGTIDIMDILMNMDIMEKKMKSNIKITTEKK
ncbi:conserved exported protein of unknown function [Tenacibaculum sp. 190524A02b]|uniref:Lipid/polyisoprenoid-binding YceI-like domain-containing protein n=1 Tax=Tenacibaculum vairaonense TaxID=3137860 RepID=A0ABM9PPF7_9FLAO